MKTHALSQAAVDLFRLHVECHGDGAVDDSTRPAYEELRRAGLVDVGHSFAGGRNSVYKLTRKGFERKVELCGQTKESA
jgi:hypothetical protein